MKLVRLAVAVTAVALVPLLPTAAHADRYVHQDTLSDVVSFTGTAGTPDPSRVVGDIAYTSVIHKRRNVIMRIKYRDLAANSEINAHLFVIRTSKMRRDVTVVASKGFY